jgi:hypothetical protein
MSAVITLGKPLTTNEFIYSFDIPGAIISKSYGVNILFFIYENCLKIEISLKTFLDVYSV